jgi:hypothetical protein
VVIATGIEYMMADWGNTRPFWIPGMSDRLMRGSGGIPGGRGGLRSCFAFSYLCVRAELESAQAGVQAAR